MTGTVLGTAGYLSPEQAKGERATSASDRYALAVVAYELLTGRRPFESDSPTAEATGHVEAEVPPVSPRIDPVLRRGLAKDPEQRFPTATAFVDSLREALEGDAGAVTTRVLPAARRSAWPLVAGVVIAALLGGAGLAALLTDGGASQATHRTTADQPPPPQRRPPPPPEPPPPPPPPPPPAASGEKLTDQATARLESGDFAGAAALASQALRTLRGQMPYEAYAEYDLGAALVGLGRCLEALPHLDRSQQLQGHRKPIDEARNACKHVGKPHRRRGKRH
jgi:hypothetical protein